MALAEKLRPLASRPSRHSLVSGQISNREERETSSGLHADGKQETAGNDCNPTISNGV